MKEKWIAVKGYGNKYQISNLGRVYSNARKRLLEIQSRNGYAQIGLWSDGKRKTHRIHKLVAEHFIFNDDPNGKPFVLHGINGLTDNSVNNLSWGDQAANMDDKNRDGTNFIANKISCPQNHLYSGDNLVVRKDRHGAASRLCRSCRRSRDYFTKRKLRLGEEYTEQMVREKADAIYRGLPSV